ncbi:MAG: helix-turn-helix domain-containing protein [Ginsengibacter sp.]
MEQIFISFSKSDFQDLISGTLNACLRLNQERPPQNNKLISRKEAAGILHITLPTLLAWTMEGKVKGYRIGRRVLYKKNEIENAITEISTSQKRRM